MSQQPIVMDEVAIPLCIRRDAVSHATPLPLSDLYRRRFRRPLLHRKRMMAQIDAAHAEYQAKMPKNVPIHKLSFRYWQPNHAMIIGAEGNGLGLMVNTWLLRALQSKMRVVYITCSSMQHYGRLLLRAAQSMDIEGVIHRERCQAEWSNIALNVYEPHRFKDEQEAINFVDGCLGHLNLCNEHTIVVLDHWFYEPDHLASLLRKHLDNWSGQPIHFWLLGQNQNMFLSPALQWFRQQCTFIAWKRIEHYGMDGFMDKELLDRLRHANLHDVVMQMHGSSSFEGVVGPAVAFGVDDSGYDELLTLLYNLLRER